MAGKWRKIAAGICATVGAVYLLLVVQLFFTGISEIKLWGLWIRLRPWWKPLWVGIALIVLMLWALEEEPTLILRTRQRLTKGLSRLNFNLDRPGSGWSLAGGFIFSVLAWFAASHFYYLFPSPAGAPLASGLAVVAGALGHRLFYLASNRLLGAINRGKPPFRIAAGRIALYVIIWGLLLTFPLKHWEAMGTEPFFPLLLGALPMSAVLCWLILSSWGGAGRIGRVRRLGAVVMAGAVFAIGAYSWLDQKKGREGSGPDRVLLITMDTTRADYLSCYGYPRLTTPNLDQLAQSGVRFTAAFCPVEVTDPSHASILTGSYPRTHGLMTNFMSITGKVQSLAADFQDRGYLTASITSRAHLNPGLMNLPGFDQISAPSLAAQDTSAFDAYRRLQNFLLRHRDRDVFIWVHFFDPHGKYEYHRGASEAFVKDYHGDYSGVSTLKPGRVLSEKEIKYARDLYAGEVFYMDQYIGKSVAALRGITPRPRREPFILAIADHGECLGEYRHRRQGVVFGHGAVLYQAPLRIPLIMTWPGSIKGGQTIDQVVGAVDVAPTIFDFIFGRDRYQGQGKSLRSLMEGRTGDDYFTVSFASNAMIKRKKKGKRFERRHAFIRGPYKLLSSGGEEIELYDYRADPWEEHDLARERPEIVKRYLRDQAQWYENTPETKSNHHALSKSEINVLKALGYIQ